MSLQILGIASDIAGGKVGSANGVKLICNFITNNNIARLESKNYLIPNYKDIVKATKDNPAKYIDILYNFFINNVSIKASEIITNNNFPFIISGDHSSALACVQGIQNAISSKNEEIGIIWIDAHADIHTPFSTFSGNLHGMPLAAIIGHKEKNKNELNTFHNEYWNKICNISKVKVNPKNIIYCGIRSLESAEQDIINENKMLVLSIDEIKNNIDSCIKAMQTRFKNIQNIYISVDVDVLDCDDFKSTGCNEINGLNNKELDEFVLSIIETFNNKIIAFEVSEFNPELEISNEKDTEYIKSFINKCITHIKKYNIKARD